MKEYLYRCLHCGLVTVINEIEFKMLPIDGKCNLCGEVAVFVCSKLKGELDG